MPGLLSLTECVETSQVWVKVNLCNELPVESGECGNKKWYNFSLELAFYAAVLFSDPLPKAVYRVLWNVLERFQRVFK